MNSNRIEFGLNKPAMKSLPQKMQKVTCDEDSDDDTGVKNNKDYRKLLNRKIMKEQQNNSLKIDDQITKAYLENPSIYEYDTLYDEDSMNKNKKRNKYSQNGTTEDKPKYIEAIIEASEKRKLEQIFIKEKVEEKKRIRENDNYGNTQKYITKGYEQLLELAKTKEKKMLSEEKRDEENSVYNSEFGMMGFYSNLITKNKLYSANNQQNSSEGECFKQHEDKSHEEIQKIYLKRKRDYEVKLAIDNPQQEKETKKEKEKETSEFASTNTQKDEEDTPTPNQSNIVETSKDEYKKRYLERKRLRENKDIQLNESNKK